MTLWKEVFLSVDMLIDKNQDTQKYGVYDALLLQNDLST